MRLATTAEKYLARAAFASAISRGDLTRPQVCQKCGKQGRIDGHHADYAKPLDVEWLCRKCHHLIHREVGRFGVTSAEHPDDDLGKGMRCHNHVARLDSEEKAMLGRLAAKLGIARAGVLRMAIRRLAEVEGVLRGGPFGGPSVPEGAEVTSGRGGASD